MIVKFTYVSDSYKVKGYLGVPPGCPDAAAAIRRAASAAAGLPEDELPVELVASGARTDAAASAGLFPAIVYCRGGVRSVGRVRPHWIDSFLGRGFVVIAPCYRGDEGGEGRDEFGGADREDVRAILELVRALPFVDPARVSLFGFSRGAVNAAIAAAEDPIVHRLVQWGGVADLARTYEERVDLRRTLRRMIGNAPAKLPDAYRARSPLHLAGRWRCPTLIVHGTADAQVNAGHGLDLYARLMELGVPAELHLYQGYGHHLPYLAHEAAIDRMAEWLRGERR